ncbi:hypothetical protein DFH11DRAFT_1880569 [Phellopilus nigrolimitatus]|nr:hypothetical protein DFH11DRAFT_1880569 [Phellopilus nigrolimitatus]
MTSLSRTCRCITLHYDGPSLSDTSSLVSLDENKNRNSGSSLSLSCGSAGHVEPEDDSVIVSSRDTGLLMWKTKTVMYGGSRSTAQDFHSLSGLESESDASLFMKERYPADPSAVFERLKLCESSESIERNTQWLRDQTSRTINGIMTPDDLALRQDNGRYYYTYTSGSSSAAHDDVSIGEHGSHRVADWRDPKLHWLASQKILPSPSSSLNRQSASSSTSDSLPRTVDTPPEVRQLVPPACTDCSACGVLLDAFRYMRSTCGERTPRRDKARADVVDVSMFDPLAYPPRAHTNGKLFPARPFPTNCDHANT